jgi:hypothetical protein
MIAIKKRKLSLNKAKIPRAMVIMAGIMNQDLVLAFLANSGARHSNS